MERSESPWQQLWQPHLQEDTPICLLPTRQTPPTRLRTVLSSLPLHHTTYTTPLPLAHISSPWWLEEGAGGTRAPPQGSFHRAPMPRRARHSCTHLCQIRMMVWVWRSSQATVAPQPTWRLLKPSGDLTEAAKMAEDTNWQKDDHLRHGTQHKKRLLKVVLLIYLTKRLQRFLLGRFRAWKPDTIFIISKTRQYLNLWLKSPDETMEEWFIIKNPKKN